ncbi:myelin-associated glycoprotein-like [Archocentrus centrarchus]|uniref:myelin-associated glycoprotein-like n=1 Tax=Archocentrus centrarchus TaxID=63155 RepID=UPI0011EA1D73|nr:myelin-associated glycoprotein-like [Archocentrus centrarchus]
MDKKTKVIITCLLLEVVCSPVFGDEWKVNVVKNIDALVTSCVVVPCSFSHTGGNLPSSRLRGIWHSKGKRTDNVYDEDPTKILDNFKGRTRMLGHLGQNNCTLEITAIKYYDNGPFCFRVELVRTEDNEPTKDKFSFVDDCVELNLIPNPPKPTLIKPERVIQGQPYTVTCSVMHTCPTHVPKLTWNRKTADGIIVHHKDIKHGNWETQSTLTFVPEEADDFSELTCTAEFHGRKTSSETLTLYVKRNVLQSSKIKKEACSNAPSDGLAGNQRNQEGDQVNG